MAKHVKLVQHMLHGNAHLLRPVLAALDKAVAIPVLNRKGGRQFPL
jgi:hypothetical protein